MQVDIGIVSYNTCDILEQCLIAVELSITEAKIKIPATFTIHIIDNASSDNSIDMVREKFPHIQCYSLEFNHGFARAHNIIYSQCQGDFYILLNPDAFIHRDSLYNTIQFMIKTPSAAATGALLLNEDGSVAPSARKFPTLWRKFYDMWGLNRVLSLYDYLIKIIGKKDKHKLEVIKERDVSPLSLSAKLSVARVVDWIPGTFTLVRRVAFRQNEIFDERFFMYYEETDMCRKLQQRGWQVWFVPSIKVTHIGGASAVAHTQELKKDIIKHNSGNSKERKFHSDSTSRNNKDSHYIDTSGVQLTLWRMQSENLYIYKYSGFVGVLINVFIESSRHASRILYHYSKSKIYSLLINSRYVDAASIQNRVYLSQSKQYDSQQKILFLFQALRNTNCGRVSPAIPWK
ncbi:MAG: glycosyltransferase family 2 protein [Pseudomonadota bacterium]